MNKVFSPEAWEDYQYWVANDRELLKKVNELIRDIERGSYDGLGKPEALIGDLSGYWSRRITQGHRLIYKVVGNEIWIARCKDHYN